MLKAGIDGLTGNVSIEAMNIYMCSNFTSQLLPITKAQLRLVDNGVETCGHEGVDLWTREQRFVDKKVGTCELQVHAFGPFRVY